MDEKMAKMIVDANTKPKSFKVESVRADKKDRKELEHCVWDLFTTIKSNAKVISAKCKTCKKHVTPNVEHLLDHVRNQHGPLLDESDSQVQTGSNNNQIASRFRTRSSTRSKILVENAIFGNDTGCLFCHNQVDSDQKLSTSFVNWNRSCINSLCTLLALDKSARELLIYAKYCRSCTQIIRDIDFSIKSISVLNKNLNKYKKNLLTVVKDKVKHEDRNNLSSKKSFALYQTILSHESKSQEPENIPNKNISNENSDSEDYTNIDDDFPESPISTSIEEQIFKKSKNSRIFCKNCSFSCYKRKWLEIHQRKFHEKDPTPYHCDFLNCKLKFGTSAALIYHMKRHNGTRNIPCTSCSKLFYEEWSLKKHVKAAHKNVTELKCSYCSICCKSDNIKHHEALHKEKIAENHLFACVICPQQFTNSIDLRRHVSQEHNEGPKCERCQKVFKSGRHMLRHMKTVHSETNSEFKCSNCSFVAKNAKNLNQHKQTHLDSSFLCAQCGNAYNTKGKLNRHMMMHTGETPYKCRFCPKGFNSTCKLKCHEETHVPSKNYVCDKCGKTFRTAKNIYQHKTFHCHSGGNVTKTYVRKNRQNGKATKPKIESVDPSNTNINLEASSGSARLGTSTAATTGKDPNSLKHQEVQSKPTEAYIYNSNQQPETFNTLATPVYGNALTIIQVPSTSDTKNRGTAPASIAGNIINPNTSQFSYITTLSNWLGGSSEANNEF